jgi:DNA-binding response OmpR family regulator
MPKLDGFALCEALRKLEFAAPILFLTAKGMVRDRITGLDAGGDDYLVKPFSTEELFARVRALLRRTRKETSAATHLRLGEAEIDFTRQTAHRGGKQMRLTTKEFAILRLLAENRGEPVSRERFLDVVWGYTAFPTTRTVDNHIAMLRNKIEPEPEKPRFIHTVHGLGYKLNAVTE